MSRIILNSNVYIISCTCGLFRFYLFTKHFLNNFLEPRNTSNRQTQKRQSKGGKDGWQQIYVMKRPVRVVPERETSFSSSWQRSQGRENKEERRGFRGRLTATATGSTGRINGTGSMKQHAPVLVLCMRGDVKHLLPPTTASQNVSLLSSCQHDVIVFYTPNMIRVTLLEMGSSDPMYNHEIFTNLAQICRLE